MIGSATANKIHAIDEIKFLTSKRKLVNGNLMTGHTSRESITNNTGLLVNFFQHEIRIAALFRNIDIPINMGDFRGYRITISIKIINMIRMHNSKLIVFKDHHITGCVDKRNDIRAQVATVFANAQHNRRIFASYHDFARMIVVHYGQTIGAGKRV